MEVTNNYELNETKQNQQKFSEILSPQHYLATNTIITNIWQLQFYLSILILCQFKLLQIFFNAFFRSYTAKADEETAVKFCRLVLCSI